MIEEASQLLQEKGWVIIPEMLPDETLEKLIEGIENAYLKSREIQQRNGITDKIDGAIHHLPCFEPIFIELLEELEKTPISSIMERYFGGNYILNSFGGVKNVKNKLSYVGNIHRDIRTFSGNYNLMINMLIMLDDFSIENGATYLLPGSHRIPEAPKDEMFYKNSERAVGRRGAILLFNSNLWHAAGENNTDNERRALTLTFSKPFMKQQLDYPRFLGDVFGDTLSEKQRQVLGYNARIPSNLEEWYQPREKRLYRSDQG